MTVLLTYLEFAYLGGVIVFAVLGAPVAQQTIRRDHPNDPAWLVDVSLAIMSVGWPLTALGYILILLHKRGW